MMAVSYRLFVLMILGLACGFAGGCASSQRAGTRAMRVPPGLDKKTVVRASNLADSNFVSSKRERSAATAARQGRESLDRFDQFWSVLENQNGANAANSPAEKSRFDREFRQGSDALARWKSLTNNGADEQAAKQARHLCLAAQSHFEEALRINPFDKNVRVLLAVVYYNLQNIFGREKNHEKAIQILERLTRLEKGEHNLYRLLGENYLATKAYEPALASFQKAHEVMLKTSFMAKPDTAMLFYYAYMQGDIYARSYDAQRALAAFGEAAGYARTAQDQADLKNYRKWIDWDGGNLAASERWDKILELEPGKDYAQMAQACSKLLPQLRTRNAKLEVLHKLAVIEF